MKQCPVCGKDAIRLYPRKEESMYRCKNQGCRHVYSYPQPGKSQLIEFYKKDYYCTASCRYGQTNAIILKQILTWLPEINAPFLDVGCGEGGFFNVLSSDSKKYYTGVETDISARKTAQKRTGRRIVESLEALTQEENAFQTIVLNQVIEHLRNPVETLVQIRQLALPKAIIFIATANIDGLKARIQKQHWAQFQNRTHLHLFSQQSLTLALNRTGWKNIKPILTPINYPHHGMIKKTLHRVLRRTGLDSNLTLIAGG